MIQNVLRAIGGVGVFDVISICIFMSVFCGAVLWALRLKKPFVQAMSELPLQEDRVQKGDHLHE